VNIKEANAGLVLPSEPALGVFNEAFKSVFRFFALDNWLYSIIILMFVIFSFFILRKCNQADSAIEVVEVGILEKVLLRITNEVKSSCTQTMWGICFAVFLMLIPVIMRVGNDEKTQAIVNVLGFIPGVLIGVVQLVSAYKIITYVISKIPLATPVQPNSKPKG
jgi:hypothetical protein